MAEADRRIKVALRVRPMMAKERYEAQAIRRVDDETVAVVTDDLSDPVTCFSFDQVFDENDSQQTVYEEMAQELVDHALDGTNTTIFAYGQTGSGKTFTVLGDEGSNPGAGGAGVVVANSGLFLRVMNDLFDYQQRKASAKHVVVALSAVEIYVDEVRDLLNSKAKLAVREKGDAMVLPNLTCHAVRTMDDVMTHFKTAEKMRSTNATDMNDVSSRSHAIFFLELIQQVQSPSSPTAPSLDSIANMQPAELLAKNIVRSRIILCDLAGSERVKKSGVEGQAMTEAQAINKSLSSLGTVINAMYEDAKHVPFRQSKLTLLLRASFVDPRSRLLLIGNISPPQSSTQESLSTIRFCDRVKSLKAGKQKLFVDPDEEREFMNIVRANGSLAADIRIARAAHGYTAQAPRRIGKQVGMAPEALIDQLVIKLKQMQLDKPNEAAVWEAEVKKDAEAHTAKAIAAMHADVAKSERELEELMATVAQLTQEKATLSEDCEKKIEAKTTEAKKQKKLRRAVEEKVERAKELVASARETHAQLDQELGVLIEAAKQTTDIEEEDPTELEEYDIKLANHQIVETFAVNCAELTTVQLSYVNALQDRYRAEKLHDGSSDHYVAASCGTLMEDIVAFVVERAALIGEREIRADDSYSWFDINGLSTKLREPHQWLRPMELTRRMLLKTEPVEGHDKTYISDDEHLSLRRGGTNTSVLSDDASAKRSPTDGGGEEVANRVHRKDAHSRKASRKVTMKYEAEQQDKHYLMGVYDSPTLISDVARYLCSGTVLMKHGRSGKPHKRKFWVSSSNNQHGSKDLIWVDPENFSTAKRNYINLGDVRSIHLGAFSKVFKRNPVPETDPAFYLSFTLNLKDNSRTVDVVADTLVDFEAWVIGISHFCKVDPCWPKPIDMSKDPMLMYVPTQYRDVCSTNHISPTLYTNIRNRVKEHRDEVLMHMRLFANNIEEVYQAMGGIHLPSVNAGNAVLVTKGELRYFGNPFNVDIFRICCLWQLLREERLLYDPNFVPPSNYGRTINSPSSQ